MEIERGEGERGERGRERREGGEREMHGKLKLEREREKNAQ